MLSSSGSVDTIAELVSLAVWMVSSGKSSMYWRGVEDARVIRRLDQFAHLADGLIARVEVDVVSSSLYSSGTLLGDRCCWDHWVSRS